MGNVRRRITVLFAAVLAATAYAVGGAAPPAAADVPAPAVRPAVQWHDYFCVRDETCRTGDLNADGLDDVVAFAKSTPGVPGQVDEGDVFVSLSTGRGFRPVAKWHDYFCVADETCRIGDVNGDRRADLVAFVTKGPSAGDVWVSLNTGTGFGQARKVRSTFCALDGACEVADVDGDGQDDLISFYRSGHPVPSLEGAVRVSLSRVATTGDFLPAEFLLGVRICVEQETCAVGDVNGDSIVDLFAFVKSTRPGQDSGDVWVSAGYRTGASVAWHSPAKWAEYMCVADEQCAVADMTGDGYDDLVALDKATGNVFVAPRVGNAFTESQWWGTSACTTGRDCAVADVNSHGWFGDVLAFTKGTGGDVLVSTNAWQSPGVYRDLADQLGDTGHTPAVAVGIDGMPMIAYHDRTRKALRIMHCSNQLCSHGWQTTVSVSGFNIGTRPSIAIGADGLPVIAMSSRSSTNETDNELLVVRCSTIRCDGAWSLYRHDVNENADGGTSITIGGDGLPLVAYDVLLPGNVRAVKVLHCDTVSCSAATTRTVGKMYRRDSPPAIATGADGLGLVGYYDSLTGGLRVVHCSNATCDSFTSVSSGHGGEATTHPSIAIGADGRGIITFHQPLPESGSVQLAMARCVDVACTGLTVRAVPSGTANDGETSTAVAPSGLPVIATGVGDLHQLTLITCLDADCAASTAAVVDDRVFLGAESSFVVGADGLPFIAYFDFAGTDLWTVHCRNERCEP